MAKPLFIIVDGSNCYYSKERNGLYSSENLPSGAIFGLSSYLEQLQENYQPECLAVVFDRRAPTFRHQLYKDYKAHREPMADRLVQQLEPTRQLIQALGYRILEREGVEADDVIGSLALAASGAGYSVLIASNDKDMAQLLINDHIALLAKAGSRATAKEQRYDRSSVAKRFGENLPPELIADFLALKGDAADNIIGLANLNKTSALKLLKKYQGLAGLLAHKEEITGSQGEKLREHSERLALNLQLTTIKTDLPMDQPWDYFRRQPIDAAALAAICHKYSLAQLAAKYLETAPAHYELITSLAQLDYLIKGWERAEWLALHLETSDEDYFSGEPLGLAISAAAGSAHYLALNHRRGAGLFREDYPDNLAAAQVFAQLKPLLERPGLIKVSHNLKRLSHWLARWQINLTPAADVMLLGYVLNSTGANYDLDKLLRYHLNQSPPGREELLGRGAHKLTFAQLEPAVAADHCGRRADGIGQLYELFNRRLEEPLKRLYEDMELPLSAILTKMERHGVALDRGQLAEQSARLAAQLAELENQAYGLAGQPFNLNSTKQLREILFEKLELTPLKKTPAGQASTDESVLSQLAEEHELPRLLLQQRHLAKLKSTYTDALPRLINPVSGRLHTTFQQAVTSTGRLSSTNPNLQNIPIRSTAGQEIRSAFVAAAGWQLLSADYSQIELRVMAHFAKDPGLIAAFQQGLDIHRATASEIFAVPLDAVDREQRRSAKTINFGLIYGMSSFGLARSLKISLEEAEDYMAKYFNRYPQVLNFMEETKEFAREHQYVETLAGRRIPVLDINHKNKNLRQECERAAINAPIQGTAADILKRAMIDLERELGSDEELRLLLQVHDELVFEIRPAAVERLRERIRQIMADAVTLTVPLEVELGLGQSWLEAH